MAKPFNNIEDAVRDIKRGKFVILVDDEDRENEGDLVIATHHPVPEDYLLRTIEEAAFPLGMAPFNSRPLDSDTWQFLNDFHAIAKARAA